ncbi:unnamed protein product [Echinostoma caproni]|uniref:Vacuolar protein sorting-associated protein 51 homolog n=1 Tax=Echinostoma caproni TaxID=27848 RepID=A0A183ARH2_9TREM|nr:unnamed protein product [Echinostoma caproni]
MKLRANPEQATMMYVLRTHLEKPISHLSSSSSQSPITSDASCLRHLSDFTQHFISDSAPDARGISGFGVMPSAKAEHSLPNWFQIQGDGDLPLFKVCARSQEPKRSDRKTGIKLSHGERGKTLNMSSQIDDHMLSVRVKQIEALLDANYVINVFVKLRRNELPKCESGEDKEKGELAKMMYNIIAQRFVTAFSKIPSATVRLLERPQMTEIAAIIKRTENS